MARIDFFGKPLKQYLNRASKVLKHSEFLYAGICKLTIIPNAKELFRKSVDCKYTILFDSIDEKRMVDSLIELMNSDESFDKEIRNIILDLYSKELFRDIYTEFLYYAVKIEYTRREVSKTFDGKYKRKSKKINRSIIKEIVSRISDNSQTTFNNKHEKTWTLEDKVKRNKLNYVLQIKIRAAYEEYEIIMNTIDEMCNSNILTKKYLFAHYYDVYSNIVIEVLKNDINEENILNMSSIIFEKVNSYIYEEIFANKKNDLEYEAIKYNLFALTVAVFYQCKFLLSMED